MISASFKEFSSDIIVPWTLEYEVKFILKCTFGRAFLPLGGVLGDGIYLPVSILN